MNPKVQQLLWIVFAGALGGFASWLWSIFIGTPLKVAAAYAGWQTPLAILTCVFLGSLAAVIGVLIANTDQNDFLHAFAFAVLCGFCWRPVWEAGQAFWSEKQHEQRAEELTQQTAEHVAQLSGARATPQQLQQTTQLTADLLKAAAQVRNPEVQAAAAQGANDAIAAITKASSDSPAATTTALERIGVVALETGQREVAARTVNSLYVLGEQTATAPNGQKTTSEVHDALSTLAATGKTSAPGLAADANRKATRIKMISRP